jgi:hypothetical protein
MVALATAGGSSKGTSFMKRVTKLDPKLELGSGMVIAPDSPKATRCSTES